MALTTVPVSLSATALTLTTAAQPNITSVGTLTGLTVSGNIAGTLTTAAQTNITSVGTLTGLTSSGQIKSQSDFVLADSGGTNRGFVFGTASGLFARFNNGLTFQVQEAGSTKFTIASGGNATFTNDLTVSGTSTLGVVDASSFTDVITNTIYTQSSNLDIDVVLSGRDVTFTQGSTNLMVVKGDASGTTITGSVTATGSGNTALLINTGNNSGDNSQIKFGDTADDDVGQINYDHGTNAMQFRTNGGSNAMVLDSSGNTGIGVTPHSWGTFHAVAQIGRTGVIANYDGSNSNQQTLVGNNTYYGSGGYTAIEAATGGAYMNLASGDFFVATAPTVSAGSAQNFTQRLRVLNGGNVIINGGAFSSLPTGSQLNVFGDGEGIRLDGSGATSRNIRFRNVSSANPGIIIADGGLKLETEDASTDIKLHAVRNIEFKTTSTNSTAGEHRFYAYNTEFVRFKGSNNQVKVGTLAVSSATSAPLHVAQASTDVQAVFGDNNYTIDDPQIRVIGRNSANSHIRYLFTGLDADADHGFIGYNAGSGGFVNALSFDTSGKVGIGTDSPTEGLEVAGSIKITGSNRLLLPNFWIGPVPSTANNNHGAVLLVNLDYTNPNNVGFQYSGSVIANSYTGQAYFNVNIVKHYSSDAVTFDVSGDSNLGTFKTQLKLCTVSYNSVSYLAIVKHGGGTGTIFLNGYFQGWDPSVVTEVATGTYSITTTHGQLNY